MKDSSRQVLFKQMCVQYGVDVDIDKLDSMGFFTAPSSTQYHGVYVGGNFDHSMSVTEFLVEMTEAGKIKWQNPRSPFVVGMFHDICKLDTYVRLKDELDHWEHNDKAVLSGHGEKSVMLLSQFLKLTEEEVLCIRYHMGAYKKEDWSGFGSAIKLYPTVLWTHTADMYAYRVKGI